MDFGCMHPMTPVDLEGHPDVDRDSIRTRTGLNPYQGHMGPGCDRTRCPFKMLHLPHSGRGSQMLLSRTDYWEEIFPLPHVCGNMLGLISIAEAQVQID